VLDSADADWRAAAALKDPRRRAMYELIREADGPLARDDVAEATGLPRTAVGFHLDALVDAGLLVADYARPPGRGGPGAGRPRKRYATTDADVGVAVPVRRYVELSRRLSEAVLRSGSQDAELQVMRSAHDDGVEAGRRARPKDTRQSVDALMDLLRSLGYRPLPPTDQSTVRLRDCPFHAVSREVPELVCPANLMYLQGVTEGIGATDVVRAVLDEAGTGCCVSLHLDT
jgi:predicted ArsR family transcriptional regulator